MNAEKLDTDRLWMPCAICGAALPVKKQPDGSLLLLAQRCVYIPKTGQWSHRHCYEELHAPAGEGSRD